METITLLFFVLMLLVVAFLVTQAIRRDLKSHERTVRDTRRTPLHARPHAAQHTLPPQSLRHHAHKSPPRTL